MTSGKKGKQTERWQSQLKTCNSQKKIITPLIIFLFWIKFSLILEKYGKTCSHFGKESNEQEKWEKIFDTWQ